jgi:hypothetical protein
MRARVKIEGEPKSRRHRSPSSASDDSTSSENSIPAITAQTATTRLTLSERFGKIAQWSADRSNMENMNMKITKNSAGKLFLLIILKPLYIEILSCIQEAI